MSAYKFVNINPPFDIEINFWENNKQLKHIFPYKELHDLDNGGEMSSKTMWCVWLYLDPNYDNKIGKISDLNEKKSAILSYYPEFNFDDELVNKILTSYPNDCLSKAAKSFRKKQDSLETYAVLLDKYIENNELTFDTQLPGRSTIVKGTASQYADLTLKLAKIYPLYDKIKKIFEEEQAQIRIFGGGKETLMESNGLTNLSEDMIVVE